MVHLYNHTRFCQSLIFVVLILFPSWGNSQNILEQICRLDNYQPSGGHAVYLANLPGAPSPQFVYDSTGGEVFVYSDGSVHITGIVTHETQANLQWELSVWLINPREYADWTALGRGFKIEQAPASVVNANVQDWVFYEMDDSRSKLFGVPGSAYDGDTLMLSHRPSNLEFGFQVGTGANAKNGNDGISGWFSYSGSYSGIGDINANASCPQGPCDLSIDSVQTICDSSTSSFFVDITLSGSGIYNINLEGDTTIIQGPAGTFSFGPYPDTSYVSFFVEDILNDTCYQRIDSVNANCTAPVCRLGEIDSLVLVPICIGNDSFLVDLNIVGPNAAYIVNDDQGSPERCCDTTFQFGPYAEDSLITFTVYNSDDPACEISASITTNCVDTCTVSIDSLYTVCVNDDSFDVVVNFSGIGSDFSLFDNLGNPPLTGLSPGTHILGRYYNNDSVFATVIDSSFANCNDTQGPVSADCTPAPICDLAVDTFYTQCLTDSTYEVVIIISGVPSTQDGFMIFDLPGFEIFPDTLFNVGADTIAFGSYPNALSPTIIVEDLGLDRGLCFELVDSVRFTPDSSGVCNRSNFAGVAVGMSELHAEIQDEEVLLSWTSSNMDANTYYLIERRIFAGVYKVIGKRNITERNPQTGVFRFVDRELNMNSLYTYRVKEVRPDGVKAYSDVLKAMIHDQQEMNIGEVFPNPSQGASSIFISSAKAQQISCDLFDQRGAVVARSSMNLVEGVQELAIPSQDLASGLYFVKFRLENGQSYIRKILISK